MTSRSIAIIGAGPSGCMLARLLHLANIPCTIFEGDEAPDFRSQGGTLDLHDKTGIAAMKAAGLHDEFLKYARYDGEAVTICDKDLNCYIKQGASNSKNSWGRPEIDRSSLRKILLESLPEGMVKWGHKLQFINADGSLTFTNGLTKSVDLVVGADGGWSKIRAHITDEKPYYSGITGHRLKIPDAAQTAPEAYEFINCGSVFSFHDGRAIIGQQLGDGSVSVGTWIRAPESPNPKSLSSDSATPTDKTVSKAAILETYADFHPRIKDFIEKADEGSITTLNLYMLPVGFSWSHKPGFTLLGDAAHLMTPFAGEGVNLALEDSMKLTEAMISGLKEKSTKALDEAIASYERSMFTRTRKTAGITKAMMDAQFFTPGAPRTGIETYVLRAASDSFPLILYPLLWIAVRVWFAWVKVRLFGWRSVVGLA